MSDSTEERSSALKEARRRLQSQFSVLPLATSIDGRTFSFRAPLSLRVNPGSYVRLATEEGVVLLGQVHERTVQDVQGTDVRVVDPSRTSDDSSAHVNEATVRLHSSLIRGNGVVLGEISPTPGPSTSSGFAEAEIALATADELKGSHAVWAARRSTLNIGTMFAGGVDLPALIDARGFNRQTFLCGQSGSGKTYSLGVLLEQILMNTNLRVAVLDPNADYVRLHELHERRRTEGTDPNGDPSIARFQRRLRDLHVLRPPAVRAPESSTLAVRLSDMPLTDQAHMLALDPLDDRDEFQTLRLVEQKIGRDAFGIADVQASCVTEDDEAARRLQLRIANLEVDRWSVWAEDDSESLSDHLNTDWRAMVLDVSQFEHPVERSVVALATLRHFWNRRESREPVLLVIDEAHNVCPKEPADAVQAAATELAISIAGEGRKYGIYLLLSTQRPDKLHPNVVSQCDNLMLMRMNSTTDLGDLQRMFSFVPPAVIETSLAFRQGEALIAGKLVPTPLLVRMGQRFSEEGGADVPTTWAELPD